MLTLATSIFLTCAALLCLCLAFEAVRRMFGK